LGESQAYEARRKAGKPPIPTFAELFAKAPSAALRQEALDVAAQFRGQQAIAVRRILATAAREEKNRRLPLTTKYKRSWETYTQAVCDAFANLERVLQHHDVHPTHSLETLAWLQQLKGDEVNEPRRRRGRPALPHYRMALERFQKIDVLGDDARVMLRGLGITPPTGPRPN